MIKYYATTKSDVQRAFNDLKKECILQKKGKLQIYYTQNNTIFYKRKFSAYKEYRVWKDM